MYNQVWLSFGVGFIPGSKRKALDTKGKKSKKLKVTEIDNDAEEDEEDEEYDSSVRLLIQVSSFFLPR